MFNKVYYDYTSLVMQHRSVNLYAENKEVYIWHDNVRNLEYTRAVHKETELFKFITLLTTYSNLSPSKYSLPLLIHRAQRFFQFRNASWNVFCGVARRSLIEFSSISSTV